jgi:hypothetical protein
MEATSVAVVRVEPYFSEGEQQALAGFLSRYRGLTRDAYALDLSQPSPSLCHPPQRVPAG